MRAALTKTFRFEAAHFLPAVKPGHKCRRLHGHSWRVDITVYGEVSPEMGMVLDYARLTDAWRPLEAMLTARPLNEIKGLENPTSELLTAWLWERLKRSLPQLVEIAVWETESAVCRYRGE